MARCSPLLLLLFGGVYHNKKMDNDKGKRIIVENPLQIKCAQVLCQMFTIWPLAITMERARTKKETSLSEKFIDKGVMCA